MVQGEGIVQNQLLPPPLDTPLEEAINFINM